MLTEIALRDYDWMQADFKNVIKKENTFVAFHMFLYNTNAKLHTNRHLQIRNIFESK